MNRDNKKLAQAETVQERVFKQWLRVRTNRILESVEVADVLQRYGISVGDGDRAEQFSCPFHGEDGKPSARMHPSTADDPSHVWCYVCQEQWNVIGVFRKFNGDVSFTAALTLLERLYGLPAIEMPREIEDEAPKDTRYSSLLDVCERRLRSARDSFGADMMSFLKISTILDRMTYRVEHKTTTIEDGCKALRQILDKISEKVASDVTAFETPDTGEGPDPSLGHVGEERNMGG